MNFPPSVILRQAVLAFEQARQRPTTTPDELKALAQRAVNQAGAFDLLPAQGGSLGFKVPFDYRCAMSLARLIHKGRPDLDDRWLLWQRLTAPPPEPPDQLRRAWNEAWGAALRMLKSGDGFERLEETDAEAQAFLQCFEAWHSHQAKLSPTI